MYPSVRHPWAGAFVRDLNRNLEKLGHEIILVAIRDTRKGWHIPLKYARLSLGAARRALTADFDLVHCHYVYPTGLVGAAVAALRRKPLVVTAHGSDVLRRADGLSMALTRWALGRADAINAVSDAAADHIVRHFGQARSKIVVCDMGVDLDLFAVKGRRPREGERKGPFRLLFVGRLVDLKGWRYLLDAAGRLRERGRDVSVTLVGPGDRGSVVEYASHLGIRDCVNVVGVLSHEEIPSAMAEADAMVLPSLSEGLPVTVLEAMACGLPVIATEVGGLGQLIRNGENGLLVRPGDPAAIEDAVDRLMADPALRSKMIERGLHTARLHSTQRAAEVMDELYRKVVSRG
jgi:glycosyltransferase involved in cell wall biosynthesis